MAKFTIIRPTSLLGSLRKPRVWATDDNRKWAVFPFNLSSHNPIYNVKYQFPSLAQRRRLLKPSNNSTRESMTYLDSKWYAANWRACALHFSKGMQCAMRSSSHCDSFEDPWSTTLDGVPSNSCFFKTASGVKTTARPRDSLMRFDHRVASERALWPSSEMVKKQLKNPTWIQPLLWTIGRETAEQGDKMSASRVES